MTCLDKYQMSEFYEIFSFVDYLDNLVDFRRWFTRRVFLIFYIFQSISDNIPGGTNNFLYQLGRSMDS